jgi:hypothetical protein
VHRTLSVLALALALVGPGLAVAPPAHAVETCGGHPATMVFGDGDDVVTGTVGDDVVVVGGAEGGAGPDTCAAAVRVSC